MQEKCSRSTRVNVMMGEGVVEKTPCVIISEGIGSCMIVALYDAGLKQGALSHIMLCDSSYVMPTDNPYSCAETAIEKMLHELRCRGSRIECIAAKLAGGARMFSYNNGKLPSIGEQNVKSIKHILKKKGIPIEGEDTGDRHGRSIEFHLDSGNMIVRMIGKKERVI